MTGHPTLFDAGEPDPPKPVAGKRVHRQPPEPFAEPPKLARFPDFYRADIAAGLEGIIAEFNAGHATEDELYRYLRGSPFVLTPSELVRLAEWLVNLLRAGT